MSRVKWLVVNFLLASNKKCMVNYLTIFLKIYISFKKGSLEKNTKTRDTKRSIDIDRSEGLQTVFPSCIIHLTHYQTTNFRLFQTERICRRQFQIWRKCQKVIQMGRKHCGKRRNCSLPAVSPFATVFSKGLFPQGRQKVSLCGNGLNISFPINLRIKQSLKAEVSKSFFKIDEKDIKWNFKMGGG